MFKYIVRKLNHKLLSAKMNEIKNQSPFLYNILTEVIEKDSMYYAFQDIEKGNKVSISQRKIGRIIFRLDNLLKLKNFLFINNKSDFSYLYASKVSSKNNILITDKNIEQQNSNITIYDDKKIDLGCLYIYSDNSYLHYEKHKDKLSENSVMVVRGIHKSKSATADWLKIISNNSITQSIDLYNFGLVFFNKDLRKENYKIRYI